MMKPIPIKAAEKIAKTYGYDQVVVVARAIGEGEHVTTYGVGHENCAVAARIGQFLKSQIMKWPGNDERERLKLEMAEKDQRIQELEEALAAMRGVFDTPIARRKIPGDYANEARKLARAASKQEGADHG